MRLVDLDTPAFAVFLGSRLYLYLIEIHLGSRWELRYYAVSADCPILMIITLWYIRL